jgi:hypothetical protein
VTGGISRIVHVDAGRIIVRRGWGVYSVFTADWRMVAYNVRSLADALNANLAGPTLNISYTA